MVDKLLLLKGEPYRVSEHVVVNNPTIGQITNFGEDKYWNVLSQLCATSFDWRLELEEKGVDYVTIDDWKMFYNTCFGLKKEEIQIILPGIDFLTLAPVKEENTGRVVLKEFDYENGFGKTVIDEAIYYNMVDFIRSCHNISRNFKIPGNKRARDVYMRDAREAREFAGRRKFESMLEPLVSAMCNSEGFKYNFETVWDLPIYTFMDATRRVQKIKSADHLMAGMYGGMLDVSKMNKAKLNKDLNWMGELK